MVSLHDEFDLALIRAAIARDLPVLAVCRGMQILNVAMGGTLVQDLEVEGHWMAEHEVTIDGDSLLAEAAEAMHLRHCYSVHHQGLDELGTGIMPVAYDDHGLVEAVQHTEASWIIGVQWHPEDTTSVEPAQQRIFDELIRRASAH